MVTPEITRQVDDLTRKASILNDLLATDRLYQERVPAAAAFAQRVFFERFASPRYMAEGIENLQAAIDATKAENVIIDQTNLDKPEEERQKRKSLILSPRHGADADHLVMRYIFDREGYGGLLDEAFFIAGVNMLKRPGIRIFMRAENVLYIATPDDLINSRNLLKRGVAMGLNQTQIDSIQQARDIFVESNQKAGLKHDELVEDGMTVAVYAEGGRPYDGLMKVISPYVAVYFPQDGSANVVHMRMYGAAEFNPPNKTFQFWRALPGLQQQFGIKIDPHHSSADIWAKWSSAGDLIGAFIANVDPSDVRVSDLMRYFDLMERYHPDQNSLWVPNLVKELWEGPNFVSINQEQVSYEKDRAVS